MLHVKTFPLKTCALCVCTRLRNFCIVKLDDGPCWTRSPTCTRVTCNVCAVADLAKTCVGMSCVHLDDTWIKLKLPIAETMLQLNALCFSWMFQSLLQYFCRSRPYVSDCSLCCSVSKPVLLSSLWICNASVDPALIVKSSAAELDNAITACVLLP